MILAMGVYQRDGRWYARWRVKGRLVRRSLGDGIRTEAQAQSVWREMEKAQLRDKLGMLDPSTKNLGQFIQEYLAHRQPLNLSPHTKRQDAKALGSLASVLGASCLLRTIKQKKIDEWAGALLGQGLSPRSINSYLSHILAALNTAVDWDWLAALPRIKKVKTPQRLPRALTPGEVDRILAQELNPERRALWEFFLWTGARRQEVLDLDWRDLHLEDEAPWARLVGKGDKERVVPLMPDAVRALGAMPRADMGPVWIFSRYHYRGRVRVTADAVSHWFKLRARQAGVQAHLHDLRHTAATWMAARGVSERVIQEIMGHASIVTTQVYTKGMARVANLYQEMARGLSGNSLNSLTSPVSQK